MNTQTSTNNIESYILDLLDDHSSAGKDDRSAQADPVMDDSSDSLDHTASEVATLPDDDKYLSFSVSGSDFLIAANQVVSVKSFLNTEGYRHYRLYNVDALLDLGRLMESGLSQFVLILRGEQDYAIRVDTIHGLVTVSAERLLIRKKIKDRPWYTAISRDYQSALLNSYMLGKSLRNS